MLGPAGLAESAHGQTLHYRIIVLEPPDVDPDPTFVHLKMKINNRGEIVGTAQRGNPNSRPWVWLPSGNYGMSPGTSVLPIDMDGNTFSVESINVNGIAVGHGSDVTFGGVSYVTAAWLWDLNTGASGGIPLFGVPTSKEEATDVNDADPPVICAWGSDGVTTEVRAVRKVIGGSMEVLDPVGSAHDGVDVTALSDAGFIVGTSSGDAPPNWPCGLQQDFFAAASWGAGTTIGSNLATLGTSQAEARTTPEDVNNVDPSMIVGRGDDPNDPTLPCRERGLFWANAGAEPVALPFLVVNGQPVTQDAMHAYAIADPFSSDTILVVGRSFNANAAVLWRRVNGVWEAINLNTISPCGGTEWANVSHATGINSCGWIIGIGVLTDNSPRAFLLVPMDACPGDIVGADVTVPDGKVDVNDLLYVILNWFTSDCVADINGDGVVNVNELLAVITNWGACSCFPLQAPPESLSQVLADAGLTQDDWNEYMDVLGSGTETQKKNYNCWVQRYLSGCLQCPACPGRDPFSN